MKPKASVSLIKLISLVPWAYQQGGFVEVEELARRFDYNPKKLLKDLEGLTSWVSLPSGGPQSFIDIIIEDGGRRVLVSWAQFFDRAQTLEQADVLSLMIAARAVLDSSPDIEIREELLSSINKISKVFGTELDVDIHFELGETEQETLALVKRAKAEGLQIEVEYRSDSTMKTTTRVLEPKEVFFDTPEWYTHAYCVNSSAMKTFRLDRVMQIALLDTPQSFEISEAEATSSDDPSSSSALVNFDTSLAKRKIRLSVPNSSRWMLDSFPYEDLREAENRFEATFFVADDAWLKRLLLQLGPIATQHWCEPPLPSDFLSSAAQEILTRYRD